MTDPSSSHPLWIASGAALIGTLLGGAVVFTATQKAQREGQEPPQTVAPGHRESCQPCSALVDAVRKTRDSVVGVKIDGQLLGAGVVVESTGTVLTNFHVISAALSVSRPFGYPGESRPLPNRDEIQVRFFDGSEYPAQLHWADEGQDVAILRISTESASGAPQSSAPAFSAARPGSSDQLEVGQSVFVVGCPVGLDHTVSAGIVSALERTHGLWSTQTPAIQLDATINFGNSGGPLFDLAGNLVGITTTRARHGDGIGFAIPIDQIRMLVKGRNTQRRWSEIGIGVEPMLDPQKALRAAGFRAGVVVTEVKSSAAEGGKGFAVGDIIVTFRGKRFDEMGEDLRGRERIARHISQSVHAALAGDRLSFQVLRRGKLLDLEVPTAPVNLQEQVMYGAKAVLGLDMEFKGGVPRILGVEGDAPLRSFYSAKALEVLKGGRILKMHGQPVTDVETFGNHLFSLQPRGSAQGGRWISLVFEDAQGRTHLVRHFPLR